MPENEEPEGPNLPPGDGLKSASIRTTYLKTKGIVAAVAALFVVGCYLFYYYHLKTTGVKLNELYFIASGVGIAVFTGLLFTFFSNVYIRTILIFSSTFYTVLELIYIIKWAILGQAYAYFKHALIAGLIIGIIYFVYDRIVNDPGESD